MNALDVEGARQSARLKRKSFFGRIKALFCTPWSWDQDGCFLAGLADAKSHTKPRCKELEYMEGYAEGIMTELRRSPILNKIRGDKNEH